jgi:hypothetical protein
MFREVGVFFASKMVVLHGVGYSPPVISLVLEIWRVIQSSKFVIGFFVFGKGKSQAEGQSLHHYFNK